MQYIYKWIYFFQSTNHSFDYNNFFFIVFLSLVSGDDVVSDDESAVTTTTATLSGGDNSTDVDEDAEPLPRAARYTRNELPLLIIRPVNGVAPNQKPGSVYITTGNRGIYNQLQ